MIIAAWLHDAAKRIAEHRQAVMEAYIEEFMAEWEGER